MIELNFCYVKALRADMVKGSVTIQFEHAMDEQLMEAKRLLAILAYENSPVTLAITEHQPQLPFGPAHEGGK